MAINALPELTGPSYVDLILSEMETADYSLRFTELEKLSLPYSVVLIDHYTDSLVQVMDSTKYDFTITQQPESHQDRFQLLIDIINEDESQPDVSQIGELSLYPNPVTELLNIAHAGEDPEVSIVIFSSLGKRVSILTHSQIKAGYSSRFFQTGTWGVFCWSYR